MLFIFFEILIGLLLVFLYIAANFWAAKKVVDLFFTKNN